MITETTTQKENLASAPDLKLKLLTYCPSCGKHSQFAYCGTQQFPAHVAASAGLPAELHLFNCDRCGSTISHSDLLL